MTGGSASSGADRRDGPRSSGDRKKERQDAAAKRQELVPIRKSIKAAESKIERLKTEVDKLDTKLADPKLYEGDPAEVTELTQIRARYLAEIETVESEWLARSAELEEAQTAQG